MRKQRLSCYDLLLFSIAQQTEKAKAPALT
jgi:hypothetical protein